MWEGAKCIGLRCLAFSLVSCGALLNSLSEDGPLVRCLRSSSLEMVSGALSFSPGFGAVVLGGSGSLASLYFGLVGFSSPYYERTYFPLLATVQE